MPFVPDQQPAAGGNFVPDDQQGAREGHGVWDSLVAGYQSSATGLAVRGKLPDVVLDPQHSKWYERAMSGAASTVSDLPEMVGGLAAGAAAGTAVAGPVGTIVGGGAGAFAVPTAIRESLVQAYSKGAVTSSGDFLDRAAIVLGETAKSALIGGATAGAGALASRAVGSALAPAIGTSLSVPTATRLIGASGAAAEVGTMALAPAALEGRLPEPKDFADAAVLVAGMHGASAVAGKIANIYAKTGIEPADVVAQAKQDPSIADDLKAPGDDLPKAYQEVAAQTAARDVVPDPKEDPEHALRLADIVSKPFGDVPINKEPNYLNFKYVDGPQDMQAASARVSQVFADQIEQARRVPQSWEQTKAQAVELLSAQARDRGDNFEMPRSEDAFRDLAAKGMATEALAQRAAFDMASAARRVTEEGATPENVGALVQAIEMARAWTAQDQANGAEVARALNARKAAGQMRSLAEAVQNGALKYADDPEALAKLVTSLGDAKRMGKFAAGLGEATTLQKLQQLYRFSLLTGATVFQVKGVGDMMGTLERLGNSVLRVPLSVIGSGETAARFHEMTAQWGAIGQGIKDGMTAMKETWFASQFGATSDNISGYQQTFKSDLLNKITAIPHRIIEAETELFRVLNERTEMSRQATAQAMSEKFRPGTPDFAQRVTTLLQSPTAKMIAESKAAGAEATFTNKTSGMGKLIQDISNNKYGQLGGFLIPFAKVPVNLAAWSIKDTPVLGLLMDGNRADWAEGGMKRDGVLARQVVGGTVAAMAAGAVAGGVLTGGGRSLSPDQHAGRVASQIPDYSIKIGNTWYSYERFQPLGTVAMLAADLMEMHQQAEEQHKADIAKMTGAVLGHAIISMPYFEGIQQFMEAINNPDKKGARQFDSFVASWVPSILAQAASSDDPYKRRVDGLMDAVQQRIPIWRKQLLPQINPLTGEPVPNPRGLGLSASVTQENDPVLREAARLEIGVSRTPQTLHLPSKGDKKAGAVPLTPEQQNLFTSAAGQASHRILDSMVRSPEWSQMPDQMQRNVFEKIMAEGRKIGRAEAMTPEERNAESHRIAEEIASEMRPKGM